jgi:superfamily II DNA or RNA helicase
MIVRDAVNVRFEGVDLVTRKKMTEALKFVVPSAKHTPQYKLGRWDGTVNFCSLTGSTYLNVLDRILPLLNDYTITIDDRRPDFHCAFPQVVATLADHRHWPLGHQLAGQPILLRDYQIAAIELYFDNFQSVQCIATGAGKTIITACLSLAVERATGGRTIVIVPSKSLVEQTEEDYRNLGLDVGVYYGIRKETGRQHQICTWQSLSVLAKNSRSGIAQPISIMQFIAGVTCVIVDECHQSKANILRNLLCGPFAHIPLRWGLTGTIPKAEHEAISLLAAIGPVVGELRAIELQKKEVLANCHINIIQTNDSHVEFTDYDSEHHFLVTDKTRLAWSAHYIQNVSDSGNTLVLVDRIETGKVLSAMIAESVFISGSTKSKDRNKEYVEVQTVDNKVIIATYGVAAIGLNIPRLFNCVLYESGRSFVRVVQSIGRILRRANDKSSANVYDLTSNLKFSKRHLSKRKEYYREAEYPFSITKINYILNP